MNKVKVALKVEYDGTDLHGFQLQGQQPTVQKLVENAAAKIFSGAFRFAGSGRTDAGVHASAQVISLEGTLRVPLERVAWAINGMLPPTVRVREAVFAADEFHPRFSAVKKLYVYCLWTDRVTSPFWHRFAWAPQQRTRLDWESIVAATAALVGEHDFRAYMAKGRTPSSTRRQIFRAEWQTPSAWTKQTAQSNPHVTERLPLHDFHIVGNGFLYRMVRLIVGDLVRIGQGRLHPDTVARRLQTGWLGGERYLAPAHGLTLARVDYPPEVDPWAKA